MKGQEFQGQQAILKALFQEWMERLTSVFGNNGEYYPN
jgi:hypothetical protein